MKIVVYHINLAAIELYNMEHKPCENFTPVASYEGIHIKQLLLYLKQDTSFISLKHVHLWNQLEGKDFFVLLILH